MSRDSTVSHAVFDKVDRLMAELFPAAKGNRRGDGICSWTNIFGCKGRGGVNLTVGNTWFRLVTGPNHEERLYQWCKKNELVDRKNDQFIMGRKLDCEISEAMVARFGFVPPVDDHSDWRPNVHFWLVSPKSYSHDERVQLIAEDLHNFIHVLAECDEPF